MKFMNMKRSGAAVMAGVLPLSLAAPAFATSSPAPAGQVIITGTYKDIPIAVSVPTTGTAQINPYGLPVEVKKTVGTATISGQKITTHPLNIKNQGSVALNVNAGLTVTPAGGLKVVAATGTISATETAKNAIVKLQVVGLNDSAYAVPSTDVSLENTLIDKFATESTWTGAQELAATASVAGTGGAPDTAGTEAKSASRLATLGAATVGNGGIVTYGNDSIALFRLSGDVATEPTGGWEVTDGFSAKIVFKFTPAVTYAITVDTANVTGGTIVPDKTTAQAGDRVTLTMTPTTTGTCTPVIKKADGTDVTSAVMSGGVITMPAYDITISGSFA